LERDSIDRYYSEKFLAAHSADVQGYVLDFRDDTYARRFGGARVTKVDVLRQAAHTPHATIAADLARCEAIPSDTFDCILCTQVLQHIYDVAAAVRTLYRVLKPGGVILITESGNRKIDPVHIANGEEYWRFTSLALRRLFEEAFPKDHVEVKAYGNVLAAVASLRGVKAEDVRREDLDYFDQDYEVSIGLRAVKPKEASIT
jgi:SAM-dependent methyltransferase